MDINYKILGHLRWTWRKRYENYEQPMFTLPGTHNNQMQVYKYEPDTGAWTEMPKLSTARYRHTAMLAESKVFHCHHAPSYVKKAETETWWPLARKEKTSRETTTRHYFIKNLTFIGDVLTEKGPKSSEHGVKSPEICFLIPPKMAEKRNSMCIS